MGRKPKFRPKITRVKLNPEQAVLTCSCYNDGYTPAFDIRCERAILPEANGCIDKGWGQTISYDVPHIENGGGFMGVPSEASS